MLQPFKSAFMKSSTKRQEKPAGQTAAQAAGEGAKRLGRFGEATSEKKGGDMVSRIQQYAKSENERKAKEEAEKKKKKAAPPASTAPEKGFVGRMIDKYYYGKKEQ